MYSFPELIKEIRDAASLTQAEFGNTLGVSTILISMIETGQKEVSKSFLLKLAERMEVHPASITPFLFIDSNVPFTATSGVERSVATWGEKMQKMLIKQRAKKLKAYAGQ